MRVIQNNRHKATVAEKHVTLLNKSTGDEIDLIFDGKDKCEVLLDVLFNKEPK